MPPGDHVKHDPDGAGAPGAPPAPAGAARRRHPLAVGCAGLLLGMLLLWLARVPLLTAVGGYLSVGEPPRRAEAIFVFGGDAEARPFAAAELYHRGLAPRVVVPRVEAGWLNREGLMPTQTELFVRVLRLRGVPDSAIAIADLPVPSSSTVGDVRALRGWARAHHVRHVLALTSYWHTRRARLLLRRGLAGSGIEFTLCGTPSGGFQPDNWWKSENGLVTYFEEYLKLVRDTLGAADA
jgi:uncharacterized SAM-binding protein YcdF (DUF218 family)